MKPYTIKIWKFNILLHSSEYSFKTKREATIYATGIYKGFELCNQDPTGVEIKLKKD